MLLLNSSANRSDFFNTHRRLHSLSWRGTEVRSAQAPGRELWPMTSITHPDLLPHGDPAATTKYKFE